MRTNDGFLALLDSVSQNLIAVSFLDGAENPKDFSDGFQSFSCPRAMRPNVGMESGLRASVDFTNGA